MHKLSLVFLCLLALITGALAQSTPNLYTGQIPTAAQWNSYFAAKQDVLGYQPVNKAGDTMSGSLVILGKLSTAASTASQAGFNVAQGTAPTLPGNGDIWTTTTGLFVRIQGTTYGPITTASGITVGVSPVAGGSAGNVLYDNTGILGEYNQVPLGEGGTNANLTASNGGLFYSTASAGAILSGTATANQLPMSGSSAAPTWSTATYPPTAGAGTVLNAATSNTIMATATPTLGTAGNSGKLNLVGSSSGTITIQPQNGAGTYNLNLPITAGSTGQMLQSAGGGATAMTWWAPTIHSVLVGAAAAAPTAITVGTNGQLLLGQTGADPSFATMGTDATISAAGALTIANSAVTNAKIANMNAATVKANVTGGSAAPTDATVTSILDTQGSTQGSLLYRNAATWVPLTPGSSGQFLQSGGPAANLSWQTAAGTGTVTSATIAAGTSVAVSGTCAITISGTCTVGVANNGITATQLANNTVTATQLANNTVGNGQLATMGAGTVKANVTGGTAAPTDAMPSAVLDVLGSTQGQVLYRSGSAWTPLATGTAGQVLTTGGAAANPAWANISTQNTYGAGVATWNKPSAGTMVIIQLWGSGGSGGRSTATTIGASGAGGGAFCSLTLPLSLVPSSVTVTVGAGATGGTGGNTAGNNGNSTTFGSLLTAFGGGGGGTQAQGGGGGGGCGSAGGQGGGSAGTAGTADGSGLSNVGGVGGTPAGGSPGGTAYWGGGGGGSGVNGATGGAGAVTVFGGAGSAGCGNTNCAAAGTSTFGGNAGASSRTGTAGNGTAPGGAGGSTETGTSGNGGDGQAIVTTL